MLLVDTEDAENGAEAGEDDNEDAAEESKPKRQRKTPVKKAKTGSSHH